MNFIMDFNSMDEDEPTFPMGLTENNEDYMKPCDDEVNDIVPRFQRLNIYDEPIELRSEILSKPCFSAETFPSLINNNNKGTPMTDSSGKVSPTFISNTSGKIWINEVTKAAMAKENSVPETDEQAIPTNIQVDSKSQDAVQKTSKNGAIHIHPVNKKDEQKLDESEEVKEIGVENVLDESPLDLCLVRISDHNYAAAPSSTVSESKTELLSLMGDTKKTRQVASETGEISDISNTILPERRGSDRIDEDCIGDALGQNDAIVDPDSPNLSYYADVSSDDQSYIDSGVTIDSSSDTNTSSAANTALVAAKRKRKIAMFVPPASQMNQIRQRRFSIFQTPSNNIAGTETSKGNSLSGEDSKKSNAIGKASPTNSRRRYRKPKSSTQRLPITPDLKNDEEKRISPCKRKNISTENLVGATGKFRKRSISEHNSETGGKTHLVIRSRSLSPSLKVTNPFVEITPIRRSRKRTSSDFQNAGRVKSQKSSGSSDDAENK